MRTYNGLIDLVRNWANRDDEVISDSIIGDCLAYAADKAYRHLRVPPLEQTVSYSSSELEDSTYDANNGTQSITELSIPSDLIEFIQLRSLDADNKTLRVFNEKTDVRTFYDINSEKYNDSAYWTRKGNNILFSPGYRASSANTEDSVELYYYKRLYALDSRYDVTASNANLSSAFVVEVTEDNPAPTNQRTGETVSTTQLKRADYKLAATNEIVNTVYYELTVEDADIPAATVGQIRTITTSYYYGAEVSNWLKDENERILLNGALAEVFFYLNEPESADRYAQLFMNEIQELNQEERKRKASGGNVQINFTGNYLI